MKRLYYYFSLLSISFLQFSSNCLAADSFDQADVIVEKFGGPIIGILFVLFLIWRFFKKKKWFPSKGNFENSDHIWFKLTKRETNKNGNQ